MSTVPNATAQVEESAAAATRETSPVTGTSNESSAVETTSNGADVAEQELLDAGFTEDAATSDTEPVEAGDDTQETSEAGNAGYDQLLPWEQLDSYPDELYQLAARKFGIDAKLVPQVKALLKGKIDTDIAYRNMEQQLYADEPVEGEDGAAASATTEAGTIAPTDMAAMYQSAMESANSMITDEGATMYMSALGDVQKELADAYTSKDPARISAASKKALATQYGLFLMGLKDVLPKILPNVMNEVVQAEQSRISMYKNARERLASDPRYGDIDKLYNGKVFQQVLQEIPGLAEMRFRDKKSGKVLPLDSIENAMAQYKYAIHLYRGQQMGSPTELVTKAAQAGKTAAKEERNRTELGKLNAGGRSTGKVGGGESDFMTNLVNADKARNPMSFLSRSNASKKG